MRLIDGAMAVMGDLPASATRLVEVPVGAGEAQGTGVLRYTALHSIAAAQKRELARTSGLVVTIGGDCGVELASVQHALTTPGPDGDATSDDIALVWFDAHGDVNSAESSPSHAFHGMILRTLLGDGPEGLVPDTAVSPRRVVIAGARSLDDAEAAYIDEAGIRMISAAALRDPAALVEAVAATGASRVYLHVDLDVLDPSEIDGVGYPEPFGVSVLELVAAIAAVRSRFELVGAGITEFAPSSPEAASDDLPTILRIISALTR